MSDFKNANTFSLNNVHGFCMHLPQWTRTLRSSLKGWRYDMRWKANEKTEAMELVVMLMEDNQHKASYETGMELWRLVMPEAYPGCDRLQQHRQVETEAEFKVAHLEWVLGQALTATLQPEVTRATDEMRRDLKRVLAENKDCMEQLGRLKETSTAAADLFSKANQKLTKANETLWDALVLAKSALTLPAHSKPKIRAEAKGKALDAINALHEVENAAAKSESNAEPEEEPYVVRKCWFETTPTGDLLGKTAVLVANASGLSVEAALRSVNGNRDFVVLPDRWDAFNAGLKELGVEVCMEATESLNRYECWFTEPVTREKIRVIKTVREFSGLGLKEAKDATECNGHFFIPTNLWSRWQEEIAKLPESRWNYCSPRPITRER